MIFFTSDQHFHHEAIIRLANRPYQNIQDMDDALVEAWNKVVGPRDVVFHLGDFLFGNAQVAAQQWNKLNGREVWVIPGNHDSWITNGAPVIGVTASDGSVYRDKPLRVLKVDGKRIVLCHYPLREWEGRYRGYIHLYGHTHNSIPTLPGSLEVSVDCFPSPVSLDSLDTLIKPFYPGTRGQE